MRSTLPVSHDMTHMAKSSSFGDYPNMSHPAALLNHSSLVPAMGAPRNDLTNTSMHMLDATLPHRAVTQLRYESLGTPPPNNAASMMNIPHKTGARRSSKLARRSARSMPTGLQVPALELTGPMSMAHALYPTPSPSSHDRRSASQTAQSLLSNPTPLHRDVNTASTIANACLTHSYKLPLVSLPSGSHNVGSTYDQGTHVLPSASTRQPDPQLAQSLSKRRLLTRNKHMAWALQEHSRQIGVVCQLVKARNKNVSPATTKQVNALARRIWVLNYWNEVLALCDGNKRRVQDLQRHVSVATPRDLIKIQLACFKDRVVKNDVDFANIPNGASDLRKTILTDKICRLHAMWSMRSTKGLKRLLDRARATRTAQAETINATANQMGVFQRAASELEAFQAGAHSTEANQTEISQFVATYVEAAPAKVAEPRAIEVNAAITEAPQARALRLGEALAKLSSTHATDNEAAHVEPADREDTNKDAAGVETSNTRATDAEATQAEVNHLGVANGGVTGTVTGQPAMPIKYSLPDIHIVDQPVPALPPGEDVLGDTIGYFNEAFYWDAFKGQYDRFGA